MEEKKNEIVLPTEPRKAPLTNPTSLGIMGKHKSGKTTALSTLPGCLIIDTEQGCGFIDGIVLPVPKDMGPISKFRWLKDVARKIKDQGRPYDYVAIDTFTEIDIAAEWYGTWVYMNSIIGKEWNRKKNPDGSLVVKDGKTIMLPPDDPNYVSVSQLPNGAGWNYIRNASLDMFEELRDLGKICTIFVFHLADKVVGEKDNESVVVKDIAVTGKLRSIIPKRLDGLGTVWNEDGKLMVSFIDKGDKIGGIRGKHLPGYVGPLEWSRIFITEETKSNNNKNK